MLVQSHRIQLWSPSQWSTWIIMMDDDAAAADDDADDDDDADADANDC